MHGVEAKNTKIVIVKPFETLARDTDDGDSLNARLYIDRDRICDSDGAITKTWKNVARVAAYYVRMKCDPQFIETLTFEDKRIADVFHDVRDTNRLVHCLREMYAFLEDKSRESASEVGSDNAEKNIGGASLLSHLRNVTGKVPQLFDVDVVRAFVEREILLSDNNYRPRVSQSRVIADWSDMLTLICDVMFRAENSNQIATFLLFKLTFLCALSYTVCHRASHCNGGPGADSCASTSSCFATITPTNVRGEICAGNVAEAALFYDRAPRYVDERSALGLDDGEWYVDASDACSTIFAHAFFRIYARLRDWPLEKDVREILNNVHALRDSYVAFFKRVGRHDQHWLAFFASGKRGSDPRIYIRSDPLLDEFDRLSRCIRSSSSASTVKSGASTGEREGKGDETSNRGSCKVVAAVDARGKAFNDKYEAFLARYAEHWRTAVLGRDWRVRDWWEERHERSGSGRECSLQDFVERNTTALARMLVPYAFHSLSYDREVAVKRGAEDDGYTDERKRDYLIVQLLGALHKRGVGRENCVKTCDFVERTRERYGGMVNDFDLGAIYARMMSELSFIVDVFSDAANSLATTV